LKVIEAQLRYDGAARTDLSTLDAALDKLALASLPIKQRTVIAAAHVVGSDGEIGITEGELLRAIAAALDVPVPPLSPVSESTSGAITTA
jgi:tellurite resistance protein